jgi:hypothetical protein
MKCPHCGMAISLRERGAARDAKIIEGLKRKDPLRKIAEDNSTSAETVRQIARREGIPTVTLRERLLERNRASGSENGRKGAAAITVEGRKSQLAALEKGRSTRWQRLRAKYAWDGDGSE